MIRVVLYLLLAIILITFLRMVIGGFTRAVSNLAGLSGERDRTSARGQREGSEQLKRDPVCGIYVAPSASVTKEVRGKTIYFCSEECRDKYGEG